MKGDMMQEHAASFHRVEVMIGDGKRTVWYAMIEFFKKTVFLQ